MNPSVHSPGLFSETIPARTVEEQQRRKAAVMTILGKGLPTLPSYVLDLNALLSHPTVDLKKVGKVIRTDPSLSAQVIRLCNSALFGLRRRVFTIEQATVLLGTQRLRTLVLSSSVMEFSGRQLPQTTVHAFWQHSFMAALLSEKIARQLDYCEKEQAYLGGLLHDIGQLPLTMIVFDEEAHRRPAPPAGWQDDPQVERAYFGLDHCEAGRWMGIAWNFMPSFIDVFEYHHATDMAQHDPYLVGIVTAADQCLKLQTADDANAEAEGEGKPEADKVFFLEECLPELVETERVALLEMLNNEYVHLLPLVQLGLALSSGNGGESQTVDAGEPR
jgi:putative nucleotidyltransferase with HDIG domain